MKNTHYITIAIAVSIFCIGFVGCAAEPAGMDAEFTNAAQLQTIEGTLNSTCNLDVVGSAATCMTATAWKQQLTGVCAGSGGALGVVGYADTCGDGLWRRAKFQCCGATEAPVTDSTCGSAVTGSQDVCLGANDWMNALQNKCQKSGSNLTNITFQDSCDGGYRFANYTCCTDETAQPQETPAAEPNAPMTPQPACQMHLLGTGNTCMPASHWDTQADDICATAGKAVDAVTLGAACGADTYTFASATCCGAAEETESVPTEPIAVSHSFQDLQYTAAEIQGAAKGCKALVMGDKDMCFGEDSFVRAARYACERAGLSEMKLEFGDTCGERSYANATFTCCAVVDEKITPAPKAVEAVEQYTTEMPVMPKPERVCGNHRFGDGSTCTPMKRWKALVSNYCGKSGAEALNMEVYGQCKGQDGAKAATATCCQEEQQCVVARTISNTCMPKDDVIAAARAACESAGGKKVSALRFDDSCGKQQVRKASYTCCTK